MSKYNYLTRVLKIFYHILKHYVKHTQMFIQRNINLLLKIYKI